MASNECPVDVGYWAKQQQQERHARLNSLMTSYLGVDQYDLLPSETHCRSTLGSLCLLLLSSGCRHPNICMHYMFPNGTYISIYEHDITCTPIFSSPLFKSSENIRPDKICIRELERGAVSQSSAMSLIAFTDVCTVGNIVASKFSRVLVVAILDLLHFQIDNASPNVAVPMHKAEVLNGTEIIG